MILIVLGTWKMPFQRPLIEIEKLIKKGVINQEVVVQSGHTRYESSLMRLIPFMSHEEFEGFYEKADLIICQAGVGSIIMGLKKNKKVISLARKFEFNEHIDNHQDEILHVFSVQNYILKWDAQTDLEDLLINIGNYQPKPYPFSEEKVSTKIIEFINQNLLLKS
jgi:UDP-N-acetylglucosamine transferase subunit ALG13